MSLCRNCWGLVEEEGVGGGGLLRLSPVLGWTESPTILQTSTYDTSRPSCVE